MLRVCACRVCAWFDCCVQFNAPQSGGNDLFSQTASLASPRNSNARSCSTAHGGDLLGVDWGGGAVGGGAATAHPPPPAPRPDPKAKALASLVPSLLPHLSCHF